jgi:hypothetical protein
MSLQEQLIRQRDFSAGEIDPDAIRRDDMEILKSAVRFARNLVSTHTGGLVRRPGRRLLFRDSGIIGDFKPFEDEAYKVTFLGNRIRVRTLSGALVASFVAPWTSDDLDSLVFEPMENELFIAWTGRTKVLKVDDGTRKWTFTDYAFETGLDGAGRVPFYRFEETLGVTMRPSALTGNITVTFSKGILDPRHAGSIFRYAGRQLRCTRVLDSTSLRAQVIESLPKTYRLTVESSVGFSIGQEIETDTIGVKGEIINIDNPSANVVTIVALDKLTAPIVGEKVVGPGAASKITAVVESGAIGATLRWDEQFVSDFRGWPQSLSKDRQRLIFTNFRQKKSAILWMATGNNRDGLVGGNADDAMLEFISAECQVFHIVGGYDEFAVTDRGIFYIPVSVGTPLQPGSVEFRPIFTSEISHIRPIEVTEGLIFVDKAQTGVYSISATGQTARPYIANEINRYHRQLFNGIRSLAVASGTGEFPSRQIFCVNGDGTVVDGQFNPDRDWVGWLKWDGDGLVRSVAGAYGSVVFMSTYIFNGTSYGVAEELDYSLLCDCAKTITPGAASDFLELDNGEPLLLSNGEKLNLSGIITDFYINKTISVFGGGFYLGEYTVPSNGLVSGFEGYPSLVLGVRFDWNLKPLFPNVEGGQPVGQGEQRRKIASMMITVRDTQEFQVGNRVFGSYRGGEDMEAPVPARDETYRYREVGRSYDPEVLISGTFPGKFKLIELTTRITV